jgi:Divergent InlB B-repeat domain/IPTL-CTERM motif
MNRYLRQLTGLAGITLLLLSQLSATAHAGISGTTVRLNLSVVNSPVPIVAPTLAGNFTYGITCTTPSGPAYVWVPTTPTITVNAATPLTGIGVLYSGTATTAPSVCTVSQLTRPAPPLGYAWNGSPPAVVVSNVVNSDQLPPYETQFNNVLSPATFAVTAQANTGGTVNCVSPVTYGNTSTCTAVASSGYTFVGFTTSGCAAPTSNASFTTVAITANCNVTAQFAAIAAPIAQNIPTLGGWGLILLCALTLASAFAFRARRTD